MATVDAMVSDTGIGTGDGQLYHFDPDGGKVVLDFHPGQVRAWERRERFVCVLAGTQSGKSSWGPWWLWREIVNRGRGDYLAVTATYDLFKRKMLPALQEVFVNVLRIGRYWAADRVLEIADPATGEFLARRSDDPMWARVALRSAASDTGLEASTSNAAWLDEAGMAQFTFATWRSILRRLSLSMGRILITTTLYNFGYLRTEVYDRAVRGEPGYAVVHFDSTENPVFPREEWERARRQMSESDFDMQYRGRYRRPKGAIYDVWRDEPFERGGHILRRVSIPWTWPREVGLDFGGVNTAAVLLACDPVTGRRVAYREYLAGDLTAKMHADAIRAGEPPFRSACGGSRSEGQWRQEFVSAGLDVVAPLFSDVKLGISRVYAGFKENRLFVMEHLDGLRGELGSYARKVDDNGRVTDKIEEKSRYHRLDALRYVYSYVSGPMAVESGRNPAAGPRHHRTGARHGRHVPDF